uniref:Fibronectin type-III domain-containing protein n=1 Tax=Varanus komodoensis TaxID=61221 RepID=A0A8D2L1F3_VARKO
MGVTVQNITGNTALVIWPKMASCVDSFYSIMYNPNWDKMLSGYTRKYFQKEERVPAGRSSFVLENLIPLTTYILCVTCQSANPSSDQCRVFNTPEQDPSTTNNKKKDVAVGIWLTSTVLLLIIIGILIYGSLHIWWRKRRERSERQSIRPDNKEETWLSQLYFIRGKIRHSRKSNTLLDFPSTGRDKSTAGNQVATLALLPSHCVLGRIFECFLFEQ